MRKYLRGIARSAMKAAGMERINKEYWTVGGNGEPVRMKSKFAQEWRKWI